MRSFELSILGFENHFMKIRLLVAFALLWVGTLIVSGCATDPVAKKPKTVAATKLPDHFFVPKTAFQTTIIPQQSTQPTSDALSLSASRAPSMPFDRVFLFSSPANTVFFQSGGVDSQIHTRSWEVFLRKYKIPFETISSTQELIKRPPGTLVLPSVVVMTDQEKKAIVNFQERGGSILATWLTGVRTEGGEWCGFDFMNQAFGTRVVGDMRGLDDVNFLMVYGDSPVIHYLPAGLRVWLDHPREWYPLQLASAHASARMMNWSRNFESSTLGSAIVFDEKRVSSGSLTRSVLLGFPETLWLTTDPKMLEAIVHNALMWTLRQPDAYLANWPHPYRSASIVAVETVSNMDDPDIQFGKMLEQRGISATYYVPTDTIGLAQSGEKLQAILASGVHELAYYGDHFKGFKGQSKAVQTQRMNTMRQTVANAGLHVSPDAGFCAPADSYDPTTTLLLQQLGFGHHLTFMNTTDARLPVIAPDDSDVPTKNKALVLLPRTLMGLEEWLMEAHTDTGIQDYFTMVDLNHQMGGLSIIATPNQSGLTQEQLTAIFDNMATRQNKMWSARAGQVVNWWREKENITVKLEQGRVVPQLVVTIVGQEPLQHDAAVWVNLPEPGRHLRLTARENTTPMPTISAVDPWRSAVVLHQLTPGTYRWGLHFDLANTATHP